MIRLDEAFEQAKRFHPAVFIHTETGGVMERRFALVPGGPLHPDKLVLQETRVFRFSEDDVWASPAERNHWGFWIDTGKEAIFTNSIPRTPEMTPEQALFLRAWLLSSAMPCPRCGGANQGYSTWQHLDARIVCDNCGFPEEEHYLWREPRAGEHVPFQHEGVQP